MKKKTKKIMIISLPILILTFLIGIILFKSSFASPTSKSFNPIGQNPRTELTILEAIKLAYPSALKWNKDAQLLQAINIDLDKPGKSIGINGKRKYWNILFGVPETNKILLVTIHKGRIFRVKDLTRKGDSPYSIKEFINLKDIHYDSPQLLKKALKSGEINPGKDWAKGYNFMIRKDPETNIPVMSVIGWNADYDKMVAVYFNAITGKHLITSK